MPAAAAALAPGPAAALPARRVDHALNCRRRRSLQGQTACEAYTHQPRRRFSPRARHTIFALIRVRAQDSISHMERKDQRSLSAAWRHAVETWLVCQGLMAQRRR